MFRDQLGSVRGVVEGTDWVERGVYRPFGESVEWIDPAEEPENHNYIGERRDETGLMYLNARYYDPALGHFLSPDWFPVTEPGVGVHRYHYSLFDPINLRDPSGNSPDYGYGTRNSYDRNGTGIRRMNSDPYAYRREEPTQEELARAQAIMEGATSFVPFVDTVRTGFDDNASNLDLVGAFLFEFTGPAVDVVRSLGRVFRSAPEMPGRMEGTAGSIRDVNPTRGTQNCVNCVIATDNTLAGFPTSALPGNPTNVRVLEEYFGATFQSVTGPRHITNIMTNAGDGARGIVFGSRGPNEVGHVFNVVNQNGTIRYLDGQTGTAADLLSGYQQFFYLPTN